MAVVGAGPAGLAAAITLAERGHEVDPVRRGATRSAGSSTWPSGSRARRSSTRHCATSRNRIADTGVDLHLGRRVTAAGPGRARRRRGGAGHWRDPARPARSPARTVPNVVDYLDVLAGDAPVGDRVAIVGAGGIGFDVAEFLTVAPGKSASLDLEEWRAEWGVGRPAGGPRRSGHARPDASRAEGDPVAAQAGQARGRTGQDHGLDPSLHAGGQGRHDAARGELRAHHAPRAWS